MTCRLRLCAAACGLAVLGLAVSLVAAQRPEVPAATTCPARPEPGLSPALPVDVCIPRGFPGIAVDYFDDYSWRAFVSLVWPAAEGRRGVAAARQPVTAPGPRVFDTYKALWEVFHADGSAPPASFDAYDDARANPCGVSSQFGDLTIGSISGLDDIGQAGGGVLDGPVAAQNGRYIRTVTAYNRLAFDYIVSNRFYRRDALPPVPRPRPERPVLQFPVGAVIVKSAWLDVTGLPSSLVARMYTRPASVKRAAGTGCERVTVGLVGMHVMQKTPSRPQWIWSSFEQKDLVPPAWPDSPGAFVLHDGSQARMPAANPLALVPLVPEPVRPFNVRRDAGSPILTPTDLTTFAYQDLLAGSPFRAYKLVVTQWPRLEGDQADSIPDTVDGSVANTFPGVGAFSAFANLAMETFNQQSVQTGCMNCHNRARMGADFVWTLVDHAYPAQLLPSAAATVRSRRE